MAHDLLTKDKEEITVEIDTFSRDIGRSLTYSASYSVIK